MLYALRALSSRGVSFAIGRATAAMRVQERDGEKDVANFLKDY